MEYPRCDRCGRYYCRDGEEVDYDNCPSLMEPRDPGDIRSIYLEPETGRVYRTASKIEKETYREIDGALTPIRPRIAEVMAFCKELGIERVGVAFCIGLTWEAGRICRILEKGGLDVASVCCKCYSLEKEDLGIPRTHYIRDNEEKGCNPIMQADLLGRAGTELNLIVGLCVGHDLLFSRFSKAPVSTLVVKDRMSGHNPIPPLYSAYFTEILSRE